MASKSLKKGLPPMHPGELLREDVLPALGRTKTEIASLLGVSRQTLYDILAEKQPVTPAMALRLGTFFGNGPDFGLDLERAHALRTLEPKMRQELAAIEPVAASRRRRAARAWTGGAGHPLS